jgi:hypothetical protein
MRYCQELAGCLAKVSDLVLRGFSLPRVGDVVDVDSALVGHVEEDVVGIHTLLAPLLVPGKSRNR